MEVFEIETERLQLRQFRVEDAQDVFAIFSDEQTTLDCGGYHAFDAMDEEYDRLMQKFAGQTRYSVVRKADGRVIGVISLMSVCLIFCLTSGICAGNIENWRRPMPSSRRVSCGSPASSPHIETGMSAFSALLIMCASSISTAGCSGS